jgi:hypothetical protein
MLELPFERGSMMTFEQLAERVEQQVETILALTKERDLLLKEVEQLRGRWWSSGLRVVAVGEEEEEEDGDAE